MRHLTLALVVPMLLGCAAAARAQEYAPAYPRIRAGLERTARPSRFDARARPANPAARPAAASGHELTRTVTGNRAQSAQRDPLWNGVLIGAGAGAAGGYIWARNMCGSNDKECSYRAMPVGILAGAGIGAAVGAIFDALTP
jgi:hypothetical protein